MSKVVAIMSMSLDGYVADLNDGVAEVFDWYLTSGDVEFHTGASGGVDDDPLAKTLQQMASRRPRNCQRSLGSPERSASANACSRSSPWTPNGSRLIQPSTLRAPFEGWRLRSGDRTVTTKELQSSATSAERRKVERDCQAERMAGLVRGFPNIAVLPDRPPNGMRLSCGALKKESSFHRIYAPRQLQG